MAGQHWEDREAREFPRLDARALRDSFWEAACLTACAAVLLALVVWVLWR